MNDGDGRKAFMPNGVKQRNKRMKDFLNMLIVSRAGNDKGCIGVVLSEENGFVRYADGKRHRVGKPKLKKIKHIGLLCESGIRDIEVATDGALRKAITAYKQKQTEQNAEV